MFQAISSMNTIRMCCEDCHSLIVNLLNSTIEDSYRKQLTVDGESCILGYSNT